MIVTFVLFWLLLGVPLVIAAHQLGAGTGPTWRGALTYYAALIVALVLAPLTFHLAAGLTVSTAETAGNVAGWIEEGRQSR